MMIPELKDELRYARKERGFTQQELADKAGVTVQTINYIENGERLPSITMLELLASALGTTLSIKFIERNAALDSVPWKDLIG